MISVVFQKLKPNIPINVVAKETCFLCVSDRVQVILLQFVL